MAIINGDANDNILDGTGQADTIDGKGGNDTLNGKGGDDILIGGAGSDIYNGGAGDDIFQLAFLEVSNLESFNGGTGTDRLVFDTRATFDDLILDAGASVEEVDFDGGFLLGSVFDNTVDLTGVTTFLNFAAIELRGGDDIFRGSELAEDVKGEGGRDFLYGNGGDDILRGGGGRDKFFGGTGDDTFVTDYLETVFQESYDGGIGNDTLQVSTRLTIKGRLTLDAAASVETLDFGGATIFGNASGNEFDLTGVQTYLNYGYFNLGGGNDVFNGSELAEDLDANSGRDTIMGNGGDDIIRGGTGQDTYDGGDGDDTFQLEFLESNLNETYLGGAGTDTLKFNTRATFKQLDLSAASSVEIVDFDFGTLFGTASNNTIDFTGVHTINNFGDIRLGGGKDKFYGSELDEVIKGEAGKDTLEGNGGNDTIHGGGSDDVYDGGDGDDTFQLDFLDNSVNEVYLGGNGTDTLALNSSATMVNLTLDATASVEVINFDFATIHGTASKNIFDISHVHTFLNDGDFRLGGGNDTFIGSSQDDVVFGGDGKDTLKGREGNDTFQGGGGDDTYNGGAGDDTFILDYLENTGSETYLGGGGTDTLQMTNNNTFDMLTLDAGASVEHFNMDFATAFGNADANVFDLTGVEMILNDGTFMLQGGDDTFLGSEDDDTVQGGAGADSLNGNAGDDTLTGGSGVDEFVYNGGADTITDFNGDTLTLDDILWGEVMLTNAEILDFATEDGTDTTFDFGSGNTLILQNYTDIAGLDAVLTVV